MLIAVGISCFNDMTALCKKYCPKDLEGGKLAGFPHDDKENRQLEGQEEEEEEEEEAEPDED